MLDLSQPWDALPLAVLDFETTGVDTSHCGVVSVACVRFERGVEAGSFYSLINPGCDIPPEATAVHGLSAEHVADAPVLTDVVHEIASVAAGAIPCAFSASFDRAVLMRHVQATDVPIFDPDQSWVCHLVIVRDRDRWERGRGRHRLENVCARWGVELDGAHNALADARATGRLLYRMLAKGAVKSCPASKLLSYIEARRVAQEADFKSWIDRQPKREGAAE